MPDLVFTRPAGQDRPPLEVMVCQEPGGWTPAPYVAVESGNQIELGADELLWLVTAAGPWALERLRELQDGGQPSASGFDRPAAAAPDDDPSRAGAGSSAAGQGVPPDPRPEPAPSSREPEEAS